jgi:glycosyltransferase involved in cell wall biosynthesis
MEKGQDLLLRVLARERSRTRPVSVTFYGSGHQREGLEGMAQQLGLTNVTFAGFVRDIAAIWTDHHALVLPSRCEGLPLVLVEAMLSGRVAIVTDVGGSSEVIEDNRTGFLAAAATEDSLDEAMERGVAASR